MKLFVMSDIHSFYNEMTDALHKQGFDMNNSDHVLVICGDLFDRGPDAVKTFEFVKALNDMDRLVYICGNHEDLLFDCIENIRQRRIVERHHETNGTLDTLVQFTGIGKYDLGYGFCDLNEFEKKIKPYTDFIMENAIDYAEFVNKYVFVHGWIPCDPISGRVPENWEDASVADWQSARWLNGMNAWYRGARLEGKTIICGHFHASWGHSHLHCDRKEIPQKNHTNWQKSFEPFEDEGIMAIDACTAFSGFCNCVVLEV